MIKRILLAVDDSPDSLEAARAAIDLAGTERAEVRAVYVATDHVLDKALQSVTSRASAASRRAESAVAILVRVSHLAEKAGVKVETSLLEGDIAPAILEAAREWGADLIVMGKSARSASGEPYVGTQTRHVLEFSEQPVLVVHHRR